MHRLRLAALLAATTLLAAGCSDDDPEPRVDPTATASPTDSQSPSQSQTSDVVSPLSPVDTVKAWVDARNSAMSTGDLKPVRALAAPDCDSCADLVDPIAETYANGGHYETDGWSVVRATVTDRKPSAVQVTAGLNLADGTTYHSTTAAPVRYEEEKRIAIFELTRSGENWLVSLIGFAQ